jgi:Fe-S cluster assembly scaffold protein SufB
MKFSLKDQVKEWKIPVAKTDLPWLNLLEYVETPAHPPTPAGWELLEERLGENSSENSLFYCLHRRLYHRAYRHCVEAGKTELLQMPYFPPNFWPLLFIQVEDGASLEIQDDLCFSSSENIPFRRIHVEMGRDSKLVWKHHQHHHEDVTAYDHKKIVLGENAELKLFQHVLGGGKIFDETEIELRGNASHAFSQTLFLGNSTQQFDLRVNHLHLGKNSESVMISKGAVKGKAQASFYGNLKMEHGCTGAKARLEEHNLLLSSGARIDATPALEIRHDEVEASHSATLERVNESQLHYLESRGLAHEDAMDLILEGFFWQALQAVNDEALASRLFEQFLTHLKS